MENTLRQEFESKAVPRLSIVLRVALLMPALVALQSCSGDIAIGGRNDTGKASTDDWRSYDEEVNRLDGLYNIVLDREWPGYQYEVAVQISKMGIEKEHWFRRYFHERDLLADGQSSKGMSMLRRLCGGDNPITVKFLLNQGANPNLTDSTNFTPLFQAAIHGNAEIAQILIDNGAYVDAYCDSITPLQFAAASGHLGVMERLLEAGANASNVEVEYLGDDIDRVAVRGLLKRYLDAKEPNHLVP